MEKKALVRQPRDGSAGVQRDGEDILITATDQGEGQMIRVTEWNARRLFAMLSIILGLPLPYKIGKQIEG